MDPSTQPHVVVKPRSIRIDRATEQTFVTDALAILQTTKQAMGWESHGTYRRNSWMWKRARAMRRYQNDFSDRLSDPSSKLWRVCNKSLNLVSVTIDQHASKLARDFTSGGFIGLKPRGTEDQSFILKPTQDYLTERAMRCRLGRIIREDGIKGALKRGEAVFKALPNSRTRIIQQKTRVLLASDPETGVEREARDTSGGLITELDVWIPHSDMPDFEVLVRDPRIMRPKGGIPKYTEREVLVDITVSEPAGSDISFPFWADFIADLDKPDLDSCTIKAHLFEAKPDDLWAMLPKSLLTPAAERYWESVKGSQQETNLGQRSEQSFYRAKAGEDETTTDAAASIATPNIEQSRLYAEIWIRYDLNKDRHREDLCLLVDVEADWPIRYDHAHEVLNSQHRRHPFGVLVQNQEDKRWYGQGHYDKYNDLAEEIDADVCRISIEKGKSGNLIFEKRNATEEGRAGLPLEFRSPRTFKLTDQNTAAKAVEVVTVIAQTEPIETSLTNNLTAYMSRTGGVTPGDTQGEQLAANTATGLQILQEVRNDVVEAIREQLFDGTCLTDGIIGMLRLFTELELTGMDPGAVKAQFGNARVATGEQQPLMEPAVDPATGTPVLDADGAQVMQPVTEPEIDPATGQPAIDPATGLPITKPVLVDVTVPIADTLITWAKTLKPDQIHHMVEMVVTRSQSTQIIQTGDNIRLIYDQFIKVGMTLGAEFQRILKPTFVLQLLALDEKNPDKTLDEIIEQFAANPQLQASLLNSEDDPKQANQPSVPKTGLKSPVPPAAAPASSEQPRITGRPKPTGQPAPRPEQLVAPSI